MHHVAQLLIHKGKKGHSHTGEQLNTSVAQQTFKGLVGRGYIQPSATPYDHYLSKHVSNSGKTLFPKNKTRSSKGSSKQKKKQHQPENKTKKTHKKTQPQSSHSLIFFSSSNLLGEKYGSNYWVKRVSTSSKIQFPISGTVSCSVLE